MQFNYEHYQQQAHEAYRKAEKQRLARQMTVETVKAPVETFRQHKQAVYELRTALSAN